MKLNVKIMSILIVTIVGSLSIFTSIETKKQSEVLFSAEENKIRSLVVSSLGSISMTMWNFDKATIESTLKVLFLVNNIRSISIYNAEREFYLGARRENGQANILQEGEKLASVEGFVMEDKESLENLVAKSVEIDQSTRQVKASIWYKEEEEKNHIGYMIVNYDISEIFEKIERTKQRIIITSFLLAILICLITFIFLQQKISKRVFKLREASRKIAGGDYVQLPISKSKDEIADLINSFNQMSSSLHSYAQKMEQKVEEKTRSIRYLLDLMPIGVFSIEEEGIIGEQYSAKTPEILEKTEISGMNVKDVISAFTLSEDKKAEIHSIIDCSIGVDELSYIANEAGLIHEATYISPLGAQKILELAWTPVVNSQSIIEKILVTLIDVTDQRQQQEIEKKKNSYLKILDELLTIGEDTFRLFLRGFHTYFTKAEDILQNTQILSKDDFELLFIQYHTMKGNARSCNLSGIANAVHLVEHELVQYRSSPTSAPVATLLKLQDKITQELHTYKVTAKHKLKFSLDELNESIKIDKNDLREVIALLKEEQNPVITRLKLLIDSERGSRLDKLIATSINSLSTIAAKSKKQVPEFKVEGEINTLFANSAVSWLQGTFNHLITNSIDHGIETTEVRQRKGKGIPQLKVTISKSPKGATLVYQDDGQGIDLKKVKRKLIERKVDVSAMDINALVNSISLEGFSTTDIATELSGRGVGLGAIKKILEDHGCQFEIKPYHVDQDEFAHVQFDIQIPRIHLVV